MEFEEGGGDVGGGDEHAVEDVDDDTLLACYACHAATHTFEFAMDDTDLFADMVVDISWCEDADVLVLGLCGQDEVIHGVVPDGQGRVALPVVGGEMIVVEGEVRYFLFASCIVLGFLLGEVGKDEVDEWDGFGDNLLILERVHSLRGEIGIDAILYEGIGDLYLVVVCHPEHIPILFLRWVRSIFYRHPSL